MKEEIMAMLTNNTEYMLFSIIVIVAAMVLTLLVSLIAKKLRFAKYVPGILLLFVGMFSLFMIINDLFAKSSLDNILIALFCISSGLIALLFALIIGVITKRKY
ncbi:MAG: cytochrome C biosynthesis protein [Tissierellia bacterium]|nr:cytochrome C biosynthesis protein [Tissierellia bacterium]